MKFIVGILVLQAGIWVGCADDGKLGHSRTGSGTPASKDVTVGKNAAEGGNPTASDAAAAQNQNTTPAVTSTATTTTTTTASSTSMPDDAMLKLLGTLVVDGAKLQAVALPQGNTIQLGLGQRLPIYLVGTFSDGQKRLVTHKSLWSVSDPKMVYYDDAQHTLLGLKAGSAKLVAQVEAATITFDVVVAPPTVDLKNQDFAYDISIVSRSFLNRFSFGERVPLAVYATRPRIFSASDKINVTAETTFQISDASLAVLGDDKHTAQILAKKGAFVITATVHGRTLYAVLRVDGEKPGTPEVYQLSVGPSSVGLSLANKTFNLQNAFAYTDDHTIRAIPRSEITLKILDPSLLELMPGEANYTFKMLKAGSTKAIFRDKEGNYDVVSVNIQ